MFRMRSWAKFIFHGFEKFIRENQESTPNATQPFRPAAMIKRGTQEKSGLKKSHATIGGSVVPTRTNFAVGTKVAAFAKDLDGHKDKVWAKATFPATWNTQIVRGIVKTAGVSEYGVIWETDKQQERISLEKVTTFVVFEQDNPRSEPGSRWTC